ncbi:MAG: hypothetical protein WCH74_10520 [Chloroflexota bacterium]
MSDRAGLRLVEGAPVAGADLAVLDARTFQARCVEGYLASRVARGFSPVTIEGEAGVLERFLAIARRPAWELTAGDGALVTVTTSWEGREQIASFTLPRAANGCVEHGGYR